MKTKDNPFRNIARLELTRMFKDLATRTREDLETSLVRQWVTYEGHAGVITPVHNAWFKLVKQGDGYHVGTDPCDSRVAAMLREYGAAEEEFRELFHRANLSQRADFIGRGGTLCRLSIDPRERRVTVGFSPEGDDE